MKTFSVSPHRYLTYFVLILFWLGGTSASMNPSLDPAPRLPIQQETTEVSQKEPHQAFKALSKLVKTDRKFRKKADPEKVLLSVLTVLGGLGFLALSLLLTYFAIWMFSSFLPILLLLLTTVSLSVLFTVALLKKIHNKTFKTGLVTLLFTLIITGLITIIALA